MTERELGITKLHPSFIVQKTFNVYKIMLSSTLYFKNVPCPFDKSCHRPYCHFKHGELKDLANAVQATRDFVAKHSSLPGCVVRPPSTIALRNDQSQSSHQQSKLQICNETVPAYYPTPIRLLEVDEYNNEKDTDEKNTTYTAKVILQKISEINNHQTSKKLIRSNIKLNTLPIFYLPVVLKYHRAKI